MTQERFKRFLCGFLAAVISFAMLAELTPVPSEASSFDAGTAEGTAEFSGSVLSLDEAKKSSKKNSAKKAAKKSTKAPTPTTVPFEAPEGAELTYRAFMRGSKDWSEQYTEQGKVCGKPGKGIAIDALQIGIKSDIDGKICYNTYLEDTGWTGQVSDSETSGKTNGGKQIEKIKIYLTGRLLVKYSVFYRICLEEIGWMGWAGDGTVTGMEDYRYCIEAIQIVLVERENGAAAPGNINGIVSKTTSVYKDAGKIRAYMIKKAQKYSSKTKYLILVDSQYCFMGIFKGKKNNWNLIKFWICSPGVYKTYWNRSHETVLKSKGFYSYGSQVYWATRLKKEFWIHSITYKGVGGKKVLDGRLGKRVSHGCIRLATEDAKWVYDNIPLRTKFISYKVKFL